MATPINTQTGLDYIGLGVTRLGLSELTKTDSENKIIARVAAIGGAMTAKIIVEGIVTAGSIIIETAEVNDDSYYTTKETITTSGDYTLTISDTDNYLRIKGDDTLAGTDLIANVILKKK